MGGGGAGTYFSHRFTPKQHSISQNKFLCQISKFSLCSGPTKEGTKCVKVEKDNNQLRLQDLSKETNASNEIS